MFVERSIPDAYGSESRQAGSYRVASTLAVAEAPLPAEVVTEIAATAPDGVSSRGAAGRSLVAPRASRPVQFALKRAFDFAFALTAIVALAPLLVAITIAIKLTSAGPVFFRQTRTGYMGKPFQILKFRSMYTDRCDATGVAQTVPGDPRITPIGRVLRRTNLDELPQFLNVLFGDMSVVGPRPHVPGMLAAGKLYEDLVPGYEDRHLVRPGITGLAQCSGYRGPTTAVEAAVGRVEKDVEYIRSFSLLLDIKIILATIRAELKGGAGF